MLNNSSPLPEQDQSEIRLMGLILMQSMSIGLAVGIFNTELVNPMVNGVTYSMAAFAVQDSLTAFSDVFQQIVWTRKRTGCYGKKVAIVIAQ